MIYYFEIKLNILLFIFNLVYHQYQAPLFVVL